MHNRWPAAGNGNSNARILNQIMKQNGTVSSLDISNTGLDNDGLGEICEVSVSYLHTCVSLQFSSSL